MLKTERDLRPNASDVRLCWSYVRASTDLSESCECIESTKPLSDADISLAGQKLIKGTLHQRVYTTLHNHQTAMHIAAETGHRNIVELLIEDGSELEFKDKYARTPLSRAAEKGHESVVRLLLEKGAEINLEEDDYSPLRWAIEKGHTSMALLLLAQLPDSQERQLHATVDNMRTTIDNLVTDRDKLTTMLQSLEKDKESFKQEHLRRDVKLQSSVDEMRRTIDQMKIDREKLRKTLVSLGEVPGLDSPKGDQFFLNHLGELHKLIVDTSNHRFSYPPTNTPNEILRKIPSEIPSFLDNTPASRKLRAAYIQHVISKTITYRIFQPFLFTLERHYDKANTFFHVLSIDIRQKSVCQEAFWRQQTLKAAYTTSNAKEAVNAAATAIVDEIINHIKHFAGAKQPDALLTDIRRIVELAAETWRHARIERELILATMPASESESVWDDEWEDITGRSVDYCKSRNPNSHVLLRLFPRIYREATHEDFGEDTKKAKECVYSRGMVLLSDSASVLARREELRVVSRRGTPIGSRTSPDVMPPSPFSHLSKQSTGAKWLISPQDKARFDNIFATLDTAKDGIISGDQAVTFFANSQLSDDTLSEIWDLADVDADGNLTKDEFAVAMYLIRQHRGNKQPLPATLPPALIPPSMRRPE